MPIWPSSGVCCENNIIAMIPINFGRCNKARPKSFLAQRSDLDVRLYPCFDFIDEEGCLTGSLQNIEKKWI